LTSGNSDTRSYNASLTVAHDPKTRNLFKAEGLYLRAEQNGEASADKTALGLRDEYKLSSRIFTFGELGFLRDRFKQLDSLVSPLVGLGVHAVDTSRTKLSLGVAFGAAFEKLAGRDATTSGAAQASQSLTLQLSPSAALTQGATALWKLEDFGDAIYRLNVGLTSSVSARLELKVTYTKDIKTRPPQTTLQKSDDSLLANLVFKL
jgi:putative salt-induced outer membrane protein YdiY